MDLRFSYTITRPLPYRFFTLFVAVLFIVATVLLSLFNTISTGYELRVQYHADPNSTLAGKQWYDKPGFSGFKKMSSSCESKEISLQQTLNTDKRALMYTLSSVKQKESTDGDNSPSLVYLNNPLEDCTINYIKIEMESVSRTAQQVSWAQWGPVAFAAISCSIHNSVGHIRFNITTQYDLVPSNAAQPYDVSISSSWKNAGEQNIFQFIRSSNTQDAAMWWAESLMSYSWVVAAGKMLNYSNSIDARYVKGSINFWPSRNASDISAADFFYSSYFFIEEHGTVSSTRVGLDGDPTEMLESADSLAKAFYSTILADLGSSDGPNILTDDRTLSAFTSNYSKVDSDWVPVGPANGSYDSLRTMTGKPNITASTFVGNYLCQVPRLKVPVSLVVSVLLADLVFLRALWTIVTFATEYYLKSKDPSANQCFSCVKSVSTSEFDRVETTPRSPSDIQYRKVQQEVHE